MPARLTNKLLANEKFDRVRFCDAINPENKLTIHSYPNLLRKHCERIFSGCEPTRQFSHAMKILNDYDCFYGL